MSTHFERARSLNEGKGVLVCSEPSVARLILSSGQKGANWEEYYPEIVACLVAGEETTH